MTATLEKQQETYKENFEINKAKTRLASKLEDSLVIGGSSSKMDGVDLATYLVIAVIFDLLSLIPAAGSVLGPLGIGVLSLIFWIKGVPKFGTTAGLAAVVEAIPVGDWLPSNIALVVRAYFLCKAQEKIPGAALLTKLPTK